MKLDKWIAVLFLLLSLIYGYTAFTYELLPFERNMSFLPNTMPMALSVLGGILALVLILAPETAPDGGDVLGNIDTSNLRQYKLGQAIGLLVAMVLYALALRPIGFITATVLFLAGTSFILGERRYLVMIPIALTGAFAIWFLVQEILGIFLRPWPRFIV
ncbi:MAG: tripartite tricarboxylate transporter TctB family protein [Proteobacteria bacterium]|nr:tripartite tricarboxylate transporter TctB family protein [Pseudomonadota bacterium]